MRKKQPSKRELSRQLEATTHERGAASSQVALLERKLDDMRRERNTERALVEQVCRLILGTQPNSSLLPTALQTRDLDPHFTRLVPPTYVEPLFGPGTVSSHDVMHPINLHDLLVYLEEHHATWERLVTFAFKPSSSGLSDTRLHYKISDEVLRNRAGMQYLAEDVTRRFFRALEAQFK